MASYNRIVLMGNLTRNVDLRYLATGTPLASFGIAVDERVRKGDRWEEHTNLFEVSAFGELAEACAAFLAKGRKVLLEGRLRQERWESGGERHTRVRVIVDAVRFPEGQPGLLPPADAVPLEEDGKDIPS